MTSGDARVTETSRPNYPATQGDNLATQDDDNRMARRAALSGFLGTVLEFYDFLLYGTAAALVFGPLFFPSTNPTTGTLASLATFGVAYLVRPMGAILFGHYGDRVGRKRVLQATILLMGGSSALLGLLPTYETIGILAPILLVLCRIAQGLSAGGEQTGASLLTMEHASKGKQTLYASWTPNGGGVGSLLATLAFIPVTALPEEDMMSWGWRIPFLLSIVTVAYTLYVRRSVDESPAFTDKTVSAAATRAPALEVLTNHRRALICVFTCALLQSIFAFTTVFSLTLAAKDGAVGAPTMLTAIAASQFVSFLLVPLWAVLSDKIGLKPIFVIGALLCAVGCVGFTAAVLSGNVYLAVGAALLLKGVVYSAPYGIWPVFYGRQFPAAVRYSGTAMGQQTSYVVTGFVPTICAFLLATTGAVSVAVFAAALCTLAALAGALSREARE